MNYRHEFHAGNFADVIKHVALTAILLHLRKKDKPFRVIDTHAGRGLYDLSSAPAQRTQEFASGIGRLRPLAHDAQMPEALRTYLEIVASYGAASYPGSPLIAAKLLRDSDRLIAIERQPEAAAALREALRPFKTAKAITGDGYALLSGLLPPPERRGLVLIDPPYEADDEWTRMTAALAQARKRFATGIYLVWYPLKSAAATDAFSGELLGQGTSNILRIVIDRHEEPSVDGKERLTAAGLVIVNPPYGMAEEMTAVAAVLAPYLGAPAKIDVALL